MKLIYLDYDLNRECEKFETFVTDHGAGAAAIRGKPDAAADRKARLEFFRRRIASLPPNERQFLIVLRRVWEETRGSPKTKRRRTWQLLGISYPTYMRRLKKLRIFFNA